MNNVNYTIRALIGQSIQYFGISKRRARLLFGEINVSGATFLYSAVEKHSLCSNIHHRFYLENILFVRFLKID